VELSFVLSALRRRLWLVALITALGLVPYLLLVDSDAPNQQFRSEAKVDIQQPTQTQGGFIGDPNRYVIGQLAVLESATLVSEVSTQLQLDQELVRTSVVIEQQPETDVVSVIAEAETPETAQAIAQAYIDNYMDSLETDRSDLDELARLAQRIQELEDRVDTENDRIQEGMEPFVDGARRRTTAAQVMPQIDAVVPDALSSRNLAEAELEQLIATRNSVISNSRLRVNTTVIQNATLPTEPLPQRQELLAAAGLAGGLLLGVVAALAWARFSTKVLDEDTAAEILGVPVVAEMPFYRSLARHPLAAFQALPRSAVPVVDQLCVLAEARAHIDQPLAVVVAGTQRGAGSTTLALAMAERFAAGGSSVVLVDADVRDPRITAVFNATADGGVPSVVANDGALIDQRGRSVFTRTMDPEVSVLGLGPNRGQAALRRDTVSLVLEAARRKAQVVVIDGGPALDLASTLQFSALADAVVLAVPLSRQKVDILADLSRQVGVERQRLLPVVTSPSRRPARGTSVSSTGQISTPGLSSAPGGDNGVAAAATRTGVIPQGEVPGTGGNPPGTRSPESQTR
jgi:Mrp family chromosome partitioning ATPase